MVRVIRGFTLIEIIVALAITATVSVIAFAGLSSAIAARDSLIAEEARLRDLQRFFGLFGRDLRHLVGRPVTNEYGEQEAALLAEENSLQRLALTRNAWDNFSGLPRSSLQRVSWWLDGTELHRGYWPVLDRASETPTLDALVLDDVLELEVRFLIAQAEVAEENQDVADDDAWTVTWPTDGLPIEALPRAVEVTVEIEDWGRATRLFLPVGAN